MRALKVTGLGLILFSVFLFRLEAQTDTKQSLLFDSGWRFHRGGAQGAEDPAFDDSKWRIVDLPHDWSIEDLPGTNSPFNPDAISQVSGGFTTGGTGWYRKLFIVPARSEGNCIIIMFDGVYMNSEVWLNGELLGDHPYGYTPFWFDISNKIRFSQPNVIVVKVKNEGENSRWYSGSGIYRHVWLKTLSPLHTAPWGICITTPRIDVKEATIKIKTSISNSGNRVTPFKLVTKIIDPKGKIVSQNETESSVDPMKTGITEQEIILKNPMLWYTESPDLYTAITEISESGKLTDSTVTAFGIRSVSFDAVNGFLLNGKPLKLKGGCVHNDNGILGSRAYDRAEERRVELLKSSGFNAIRSAHNPPSVAFLDACDRSGMLVIDESFDMWREGKNPNDYHLFFNDWWKKDVESMVLRDRNHPSVILWSIGNEIPGREKQDVIELAKQSAEYFHLLDPTQPVTSAVNNLLQQQDAYFSALDVAGYNYASGGDHNVKNIYEADHEHMPGRVMVGTESYPLEAFGSWMDVIDHPYVTGDFVWTAFDYIGEASIGWRGYYQKQNFFPWNLAFCGDLDICGWKRAQSYYRDVLWNTSKLSIWVTPPQPSFEMNPDRQSWSKWHWLDVVNDWTWPGNEGKLMDVSVYSSCNEVELFLNGRSLGRKSTDRTTKFIAEWKVPYEAGSLKAVGLTSKKKVAESELKTAAGVSAIKLSADRIRIIPNGQDLSYVTVELTDKNGITNPKAENALSFQISGPATIVGVGNANPVSIESYQQPERKAWHGKCLVVIKAGTSPGKIKLTVSSQGIESNSIVIESTE
jgi:beta-galactosidase